MTKSEKDNAIADLYVELASEIWAEDADPNETVKSIRERVFAKYPAEIVEGLRAHLNAEAPKEQAV